MRQRLTVISVLGVFAALAVSSTGMAGVARDTGTVPARLAATTAVTLSASKSVVGPEGHPSKRYSAFLTARVTPAQAGVPIEWWVKRFDQTAFAQIGTGTTASDGSIKTRDVVMFTKTTWQVRVPATAEAGVISSNVVTVKVRAFVAFGTSGTPGKFYIATPHSYPNYNLLRGKFALIQRGRSDRGPWVTLRRVTLLGRQPSNFSLSLPVGRSYLRAHLPAAQAAPAYVASTSKTIVVNRTR